MAVPIVFGSINVNAQDTNATVSIGQNTQSGWNAHSKNNFGYGMLFGWNVATNSLNYVFDPDVTDTAINDNENNPTNQGQAL
ncbi:hypothetical protein NC797_13780 [Aquibacillus sp. 3ASR75-11]|uniref:Uncharacterized protein n=1 Tax=Terrihalobacillus insolitus TaxID=2950438 RepID=A0A9X4AML5_9BACI|nr:hypothetical protein [Terrihalobacillus insolitus]MDC3413713.1 hypothetical protein [Terrihalobacillus insolitus]MDC3425572.1 hypothetical protein [Terrihalobacillus insolitus]